MAGRPTLLTPELIEKAKGYLATCVEYQNDGTNKTVRLPSIEGLALFLHVGRSNIYEWRDGGRDEKSTIDPELQAQFADILEEILSTQASFLLNNGLNGNYNSTISALVLGKHGYVKEQHSDHTTGGKPLPILGGEQIK